MRPQGRNRNFSRASAQNTKYTLCRGVMVVFFDKDPYYKIYLIVRGEKCCQPRGRELALPEILLWTDPIGAS